MVCILESVLSQEDLKICQTAVLKDQLYKIHSSTDSTPSNFMASHLGEDSNPVYQKILDSVYSKNILQAGFSVIRAYVNANPSGHCNGGSYHEDDGSITILYYPCVWHPSYKGGTEFAGGKVIEYVENRAVLFDANTPHRAAPHFNPNGFRFSVAFKTDAHWA